MNLPAPTIAVMSLLATAAATAAKHDGISRTTDFTSSGAAQCGGVERSSLSTVCEKLADEVRRRCSCDPPGVLRPPGFDCEALCSPSPPPPQRILTFDKLSFLQRCDTLEFTQIGSLRKLINRLRNSAFAEALGVYIRDLEHAAEQLDKLSVKLEEFNSNCQAFNDQSYGFDTDAQAWNQSDCVSGVPEFRAGICASRRDDLLQKRSTLEDRYNSELSPTGDDLTNTFQRISAKAELAVKNANILLSPDNTEQVLRLYIWHVLKERTDPAFDSCRAFAKIAGALGKQVSDPELFITYLTRNVIEPSRDATILNALGILAIEAPWRAGPRVASQIRGFDSSGFKSKFKNTAEQTKNLVRHAAAHLLTGYRLPYGITPTQLITLYRDTYGQQYLRGKVAEYGDYYLAIAAGQLGVRLRHGGVHTADFGDAMVTQFCD